MQTLNHVYRTIWSEALGAWIAVSEITKSKGKRSASSLIRSTRIDNVANEASSFTSKLKPILFAVAVCFACNAQANPIGGTVASGSATFSTSGNTLTVKNTPGTIINWQGFSINANEVTNFAQQSAASTVLNRVTSANPSNILGTLQSNGRVFLVNPNGIVFGAGSTINVGGLVASTLSIADSDFQSGKYNFTGGNAATGNISNAGNITAANGGQIYLIAPNVDNTGIITAPNGAIYLAAGNSVTLVNSQDPNLAVSITAPAGNATNVGQLVASAGSLGMFGTIVQNTGAVNADSAVLQGGKIVFKSSQTTLVSGTVSANGTTGGTIEALGPQVGVMDGAVVSANGTQGGGTVLIGGDAHGANPNVENAQVAYVSPTASISADAIQNGNGGEVIVWAENATRAYGNISAMGGYQGGNGGFVETSGGYLDVSGIQVSTKATSGQTGNWLLDPYDINVVAFGTGDGTTLVSGSLPFATVGISTGNISNIDVINITGSSTSVILQATHDINFNAAVSMSVLGVSMTAQAGNNIVLNNSITSYGGAISLTANDPTSGAATGTGSILGAGVLSTQSSGHGPAQITLATSGAGTIGTGPVGSAIQLAGGEGANGGIAVTTAGGNVWLYSGTGTGALNLGTASTGGGALTVGTTGNLSVGSGSINAGGGSVSFNIGGTLTQQSAGLITGSSLSIVGGTGVGTSTTALLTNVGSLVANPTSGDIYISNSSAALTVTSLKSTTIGIVNLITSGSLSISGGADSFPTVSGTSISLTATNGSISSIAALNGPAISTTGTLTTSSVGGTTLTAYNAVSSFSASNSGSGNIEFTDNVSLFTTSGITNSASGGNIFLTDIYLNATLSNTLSTISTTGNGSITLTSDVMSFVPTYSSINAGAGNVTLATYTSTLGLSTASLPFTGLSTISTTGILGFSTGSGGITVNSNLTASSLIATSVAGYSFTTTGTITEGTNTITGGISLTTSSVGGTTLGGANAISNFNATNSGSGGISLTNSGVLNVTGISQSGGGAVSVTNTGGALTLSGAITSSAGFVTFSSDSGITSTTNMVANGAVQLTANSAGPTGNFTQTSGTIIDSSTTAGITINGYDIQVGSMASTQNVILNATHNIDIVVATQSAASGAAITSLSNVDDTYYQYTLPFGFNFYGVNYSTMYISSNGVITFNNGTSTYTNTSAGLISGDGSGLPMISPAWSDWVTYSNLNKNVYISPTASSVGVRWDVANFGDNSYTANFNAVLSQSGNIAFNYGAASTTMAPSYTATIGVSSGDGVHYTLSALDNPTSLNNLSSVLFTYNSGTGNYVETVGSTVAVPTSGGANGIYAAGNINLTAAAGTIAEATGGLLATPGLLTTSSVGGTDLSESLLGKNAVASFAATNTGGGAIKLTNIYNQFTTEAISNTGAGSDIVIDNTGGVVVAGAMTTTTGNLSLTAHSPITIASTGSINAPGGAVTLTAGSPGSLSPLDTITINGTITGSVVNLAAHYVSGNIPANAILDVAGTAPAASVLDTLAALINLLPPSFFDNLPPQEEVLVLTGDEKNEEASKLAALIAKAGGKNADLGTAKPLPICN